LPARRSARAIPLEAGDGPYRRLLAGPPETGALKSGLVTLAPGMAVGEHDTERNEEVLVPLSGSGELRVPGEPPIEIRPGMMTYAPAHTRHDVVNTGALPLRYVYLLARAE
jgi:mannose-6-phosphate isomerase-like protein (cupin superfamily)